MGKPARPTSGQEVEMEAPGPLKILKADLILLHAPSVFDFRERDDILFAYLSDSGGANVTPVFEMYPLGFLALKQWLQQFGLEVQIINVASLMLMYPQIDVHRLLTSLESQVFGFDLHWMVHCHGAIELARELKAIHPSSVTIFGGISATYYAEELIRYPVVDVVIRGYDTLEPTRLLIESVKRGNRDWTSIPNLIYKRNGTEVVRTEFSYKPTRNYNDVTVDWSFYRPAASTPMVTPSIMTLPNTGCRFDCAWCGGSRSAYSSIMGAPRSLITKDIRRVIGELNTLAETASAVNIYALQCYSESPARLHRFFEVVNERKFRSVFLEQVYLPRGNLLKKMGNSGRTYIMLSPQSSDPVISKLSGRGQFTMEEMEKWLPAAFDAGIAGVMVWFFIGMPRQGVDSVRDTVSYCVGLLSKFHRYKVLPIICPMAPFLDPGSRLFEVPREHGYRVFFRSLEEHRRALVEPLWHKRLNYETDWMSRSEIQNITYEALVKLVAAKGEWGVLPASVCQATLQLIEETTSLLGRMQRALELAGQLSPGLREEIRVYNRRLLGHSSDQIIPVPRPFGGRWYDDFTVTSQAAGALQSDAMIKLPLTSSQQC